MTFSQLCKCLDDDYAHLLYTRACYSVHAGAFGDVALLGRPKLDGAHLYSGATHTGAAAPLQLAVSSFANITEVVFENFNVPSPVSNEDFISLLHTYLQNANEEMTEQ